MRLRTLPSLLCLAAAYAQSGGAPAFEDYPSAPRYRGKAAAPQFEGGKLPGSNADTEQHRYGGLSFRAANSLLVAEGCFDGEAHTARAEPPDCARRYYQWEGSRFVLLKTLPAAAVEQ